jgi:hypothetical protein
VRRAAGAAADAVYDWTLYYMAALLLVGFIANLLIGPVAPRWWLPPEVPAATTAVAGDDGSLGIGKGGCTISTALAWSCVGIPIAWGVYVTLSQALVLFT